MNVIRNRKRHAMLSDMGQRLLSLRFCLLLFYFTTPVPVDVVFAGEERIFPFNLIGTVITYQLLDNHSRILTTKERKEIQ